MQQLSKKAKRGSKTNLTWFLVLFGAVLCGPVTAAVPPFDIPCGKLSGEDDSGPAVKRQDWPAAIAAQRVSVSQMCDNLYRWMELARIYQLAGKNAEALQIGAYAFDLQPNQIAGWIALHEEDSEQPDQNAEERLSISWNFKPLLEIPGWAESEWGRKWAAAEAARDRRIARGRDLLAALPAERRPPDFLVTGETCPFECCEYREWSVLQEIELFASADGPSLGRKLQPGEQVLGLTGNVHLRPRPIFLQRAIEAYSYTAEGEEKLEIGAGDLIFELEELGEGYSAVWYRGRILHAETGWLLPEGCLAIDAECWGDYLDKKREIPADYQWWVKVRLKDGTTAWARADFFGDMDSCG